MAPGETNTGDIVEQPEQPKQRPPITQRGTVRTKDRGNNGDASRLAKYWSREGRENHPRRCQAKFKKTPDRKCLCWAVPGGKFCKFHGGNVSAGHKRNNGGSNVRVNHLPRFYSKVLSGTLAEFVQQSLNSPAAEQLDVLEELALFRAHSAEVVREYNMACAIYNMLPDGTPAELVNKAKQTMFSCGAIMQEALERVAELTLLASKVRANQAGTVSVHDIIDVSNQFVRIVHARADEATARAIERDVKNVMRIAATKQEGTTLMPGQIEDTVRAMDATIPRQPSTNGNGRGNGKH